MRPSYHTFLSGPQNRTRAFFFSLCGVFVETIRTFSCRIKDSTSHKHLCRMAGTVNLVCNYCNETSHRAIHTKLTNSPPILPNFCLFIPKPSKPSPKSTSREESNTKKPSCVGEVVVAPSAGFLSKPAGFAWRVTPSSIKAIPSAFGSHENFPKQPSSKQAASAKTQEADGTSTFKSKSNSFQAWDKKSLASIWV